MKKVHVDDIRRSGSRDRSKQKFENSCILQRMVSQTEAVSSGQISMLWKYSCQDGLGAGCERKRERGRIMFQAV